MNFFFFISLDCGSCLQSYWTWLSFVTNQKQFFFAAALCLNVNFIIVALVYNLIGHGFRFVADQIQLSFAATVCLNVDFIIVASFYHLIGRGSRLWQTEYNFHLQQHYTRILLLRALFAAIICNYCVSMESLWEHM